jgi:hypothetical protein
MSLNRTTNSHNINRPTERFQMMIFTITSTPLFQLFLPNLERIKNQYIIICIKKSTDPTVWESKT